MGNVGRTVLRDCAASHPGGSAAVSGWASEGEGCSAPEAGELELAPGGPAAACVREPARLLPTTHYYKNASLECAHVIIIRYTHLI